MSGQVMRVIEGASAEVRTAELGALQANAADAHTIGVISLRDFGRLVVRCAIVMLPALAAVAAHAASIRGNFDRPPYYQGKVDRDLRPVAHVPVTFRNQPGSLDPTPDHSPTLAAVFDSVRIEIYRLGLTVPVSVDVGLEGRPDVRFGVRRGGTIADGSPQSPDEIDTTEPRRMTFEVEGPSKTWLGDVTAAMGDSLRAVVTIQLGFGDRWVRQKDGKGSKTIELGTDRVQPVPWLTSLDDPVHVLQLTGALVAPNGKVLRVGAEGLIARRTGMTASILGAQEVLTEDDLRTLQETESGEEPTLRVALRSLISSLLEPSKP